MSTTPLITDQSNTSAVIPIKKDIVNFAVVVKLGEDGKIKSVRHTSSEKEIATLKGEGKDKDGNTVPYTGDETIAFEQGVVAYKLGTLDAFAELIPDAEERLNIVNKGIGSKFNQKIRTALIEQDEAGNLAFQPQETAYDAISLIQEAALRTNLSPMDKAMKVISGLTPEMQAAFKKLLDAQLASSGVVTE